MCAAAHKPLGRSSPTAAPSSEATVREAAHTVTPDPSQEDYRRQEAARRQAGATTASPYVSTWLPQRTGHLGPGLGAELGHWGLAMTLIPAGENVCRRIAPLGPPRVRAGRRA